MNNRFATLIVAALVLAIMYMSFMTGVAVGNAQVHTIVIPTIQQRSLPLPHNPIHPSVPPKGQYREMSYTLSEKDRKCLALNIYWEARDQNIKGKVAIGLVTLNRVQSKHYPNSVCEVVWQKNTDKRTGKYVAQFSWTLDGKPDVPKNKRAWKQAQLIAKSFGTDGWHIADFTNGAYLYHADYVNPYWSSKYKMVAQIGSHLFYK